MQSSRGDSTASASSRRLPPPPPSSSSHHHHHHYAPPSTVRSMRLGDTGMSAGPPESSTGPLTQERMQMEQIRAKLERAQSRLARQQAAQSALPGSSRYYPPNYTSTHARTPAPPVQSVKLEDLSLQYRSSSRAAPPPSSSGYMGAYPPSTHRGYDASQRPPHQAPRQSSRHPPPTATASTRPTRQSVPAAPRDASAAPTASRHPPASSSRHHHRQQYPPELQYKSASRVDQSLPGTTLSTSAPFLVYASTSKQQLPPTASTSSRRMPPPSPLQVPQQHPVDRRTNGHDRYREPPASALRSSSAQPPPSSNSRVRFAGDLLAVDPEQAARDAAAAAKAAKVRARQQEKEAALQEMLRAERHKRAVSKDAAEKLEKEKEPVERSRRGSLPTPPKSEIDVRAFDFAAAAAVGKDEHETTTRPRRSSTAATATTAAAPPKSEIDASAFDGLAAAMRRTSATPLGGAKKTQPVLLFEDEEEKEEEEEVKEPQKPTKRNGSSDESDAIATPPTSPSSGASSAASAIDAAPTTASVIEPVAPPAAVRRPIARDYDDELFRARAAAAAANAHAQTPAAADAQSPAAKQKPLHLSIWHEDESDDDDDGDERPVIATAAAASPAPLEFNDDDSDDFNDLDDLNDSTDDECDDLMTIYEEPERSNNESLPVATTTTLPHEEIVLFKSPQTLARDRAAAVGNATTPHDSSSNNNQQTHDEEPAPETNPNQELSPAKPPASTSTSRPPASAYGSRSRPDLRSRISAALQALNTPDDAVDDKEKDATHQAPPATARRPPPSSRTMHQFHHHPASAPRGVGTASSSMLPPRSSIAVPRPPSTTIARPSVSRPRALPLAAPQSLAPQSRSQFLVPPSSSAGSSDAAPFSQRRVRHREPQELKRQLPPSIGVLAGLSSGSTTFPLNDRAFYEITWRTGEFGFSFQRVYSEASNNSSGDNKSELFLRMLLDTDRGTCESFRDVRVGDILIQIGDTRVSDLGFDAARDSGAALTKYFTDLRSQTPLRLVFQRMEVLDWEGGVEL